MKRTISESTVLSALIAAGQVARGDARSTAAVAAADDANGQRSAASAVQRWLRPIR